MRIFSFIKFLFNSAVGKFTESYKSYYYGSDNFLRYYKQTLSEVRKRKYNRYDFKKDFCNVSFNVIERHEMLKNSFNRKVGAYFEFGVFNGRATVNFLIGLKSYYENIPNYWDLYLFDSFEGLPADGDFRDRNSGFNEGDLKSFGVKFLLNQFSKVKFPDEKIKIIEGFYEESLTEALQKRYVEEGVKAHFVNIDCDYYTSTIKVLEWIEPLLEEGSVIYFDDLGLYHGNPNKGELKAIHDFNESDSSRGLALDAWLDPANRCYTFWKGKTN